MKSRYCGLYLQETIHLPEHRNNIQKRSRCSMLVHPVTSMLRGSGKIRPSFRLQTASMGRAVTFLQLLTRKCCALQCCSFWFRTLVFSSFYIMHLMHGILVVVCWVISLVKGSYKSSWCLVAAHHSASQLELWRKSFVGCSTTQTNYDICKA